MPEMHSLRRIGTSGDLEALIESSRDGVVWLFKHSLICPTSSQAFEEFSRFAETLSDGNQIGVIEIQRARDVSKDVAHRTGVRHESPQVLMIKNSEVVWHASHWNITEDALKEAAREAKSLAAPAGS